MAHLRTGGRSGRVQLTGSLLSWPGKSGNTLLQAVLAMMGALYPHRELVCVSNDGVPSELAAFLRDHPADDLQVLLKTIENAEALAACASFTKDYPIPEQGTMYHLCKNGACKAPVSDFSQLRL